MSSSEAGVRIQPWEYLIWLLVTIPLLLIGAVLWIFGLLFRLVGILGKRRIDG